MAAAVQVVAVCAGAILLLFRVRGIPAWNGIYAEDLWVFLPQALRHPWHLLIPNGGYIQLVPRVLAQFAALLPLPDAAAFFAIAGALIASGCALFVFHASAGFIRSPWLRGLLAAAVVLLPVAPIAGVDSFLRRTRVRMRAVAAVSALVVLLAAGWITDFRYWGGRSMATDWPKTSAVWLHACQHGPAGFVTAPLRETVSIPCANMHR